uniref:hypothetical protein n=1 Tax=Alistipes ihumii TaxID=1470347 RepID=UPI003FED7C6D
GLRRSAWSGTWREKRTVGKAVYRRTAGVPGIWAIRSDMPAGGFSHAVGVFVGATGECGFT